MTNLGKLATAAAFAAGVFAVSAPAASARVVCNEDGDCWHAHDGLTLAPGVHLDVHPDGWKFGEDNHHRWREHAGDHNGYWHGHDWVEQQ